MDLATPSLEWVKQSWGKRVVTTPRKAERPSPQVVRSRRLRLAAALVVLGGALSAGSLVLFSPTGQTLVAARGGTSLWQSASGLAEAQPFDGSVPVRNLADTFAFSGSASVGIGYATSNNQGLSVGVRNHPDRFEGWFAVTRSFYPATGVYHVVMTKPPGEVSGAGNQGEAVFAVQTGTTGQTGLINYVVVASDSTKGATTWIIGYAQGHLANAHLEVLDRLPASTTSSTRAITLVTDGTRTLSVWFGNQLVYSSSTLRLDIAPPFQPYLEVQSERIAYRSSFRDLWVTTGTSLEVAAPVGAVLSLVGRGGTTLAEATSHRGQARLVLAPPESRGRGTLVVRYEGRTVTLGPFNYAGGDRYQLSGLTAAGKRPLVGTP
jgi:hypothetical protein